MSLETSLLNQKTHELYLTGETSQIGKILEKAFLDWSSLAPGIPAAGMFTFEMAEVPRSLTRRPNPDRVVAARFFSSSV